MAGLGIALRGLGKAVKKGISKTLDAKGRREALKESNRKAKKVIPLVGAAGAGMVVGARVEKKKNPKLKGKK